MCVFACVVCGFYFFYLVVFLGRKRSASRYICTCYIFSLSLSIYIYTLILSLIRLLAYIGHCFSSLSFSLLDTCIRTYIQAHIYVYIFYLHFGYSRLHPLYVYRRACLGPRVFAKLWISLAHYVCPSLCLFIYLFIYPSVRVLSNISFSRFLILMALARHRNMRYRVFSIQFHSLSVFTLFLFLSFSLLALGPIRFRF